METKEIVVQENKQDIIKELMEERESLGSKLEFGQRMCAKLMARHSLLPVDLRGEYKYIDIDEWLGDRNFTRYVEVEKRLVGYMDIESVKVHLYGLMMDFWEAIGEKVARGEHREKMNLVTSFNIMRKLWEQFIIFNALDDRGKEKPILNVVFKNVQARFDGNVNIGKERNVIEDSEQNEYEP